VKAKIDHPFSEHNIVVFYQGVESPATIACISPRLRWMILELACFHYIQFISERIAEVVKILQKLLILKNLPRIIPRLPLPGSFNPSSLRKSKQCLKMVAFKNFLTLNASVDSYNIFRSRQLRATEIRAFYASWSARAILPVSPEVVQAVFVEVHRAEAEDFDKVGEPSVGHGSSHQEIERRRN